MNHQSQKVSGLVMSAALWTCAIVVSVQVHMVMAQPCLGGFKTLGDIGISPITVSQSKDGKLFFMDRRDLENSKIRMPDGSFAHAVEYTIASNTWKPIATITNTWCSSGAYLSDGTIINTAGNDGGLQAVRILRPCSIRARGLNAGFNPGCNQWSEDASKLQLASRRWYPTMSPLSDGRFIVIGGSTGGTSSRSNNPTYEFVNPYGLRTGAQFNMPFLQQATPNYLYPFVHLLPTDFLFIFANTAGIIFNYKTNSVLYNVPKIPDGISRSYPSTASSVLMPLEHRNRYRVAQVLICGGNAVYANGGTTATDTCWLVDVSRRNIIARRAVWKGPYKMARPRCMPDMLFLMDGSVLIINGVQKGVGGFQTASNPNYYPEVLRLNKAGGISVQSNFCPSPIARGYHASAILIPEGKVVLSGSNAWGRYTTRPGDPLATEYRIEMWTPPYVTQAAIPRPKINTAPGNVGYGDVFTFTITFPFAPRPRPKSKNMRVALIANSFTTHSLSMNLRYVTCPMSIVAGARFYTVTATAPPNSIVAPPGPYMLAVSYRGIPAWATWVIVG